MTMINAIPTAAQRVKRMRRCCVRSRPSADGDEEEEDRRFVEQADAGGESEDGPPEGLRSAVDETNERERAEHPEDGLEGVHGEKAVDGDVDGCDEDAEHRECLCGAEAAESPREQAGEEDGGCSGECGENADGE